MENSVTLGALYQKLREELRQNFQNLDYTTPDLDARLLVAAACDVANHAPVLDRERLVSNAQADKAYAFIKRRLKGEPVARILGEKEFFGSLFKLNDETLVPRPETEQIVEEVLVFVQEKKLFKAPIKIVDLGVGSGAILISLLRELPNAQGFGVDISFKALQMADFNAKRFNLEDRFFPICGDFGHSLAGEFDIIISNPPYIGLSEREDLSVDVRDFDPDAALFSGPDGFDAFHVILPFIREHLKKDGLALLEHGKEQAIFLQKMVRDTGFLDFETLQDMADLPRFMKIYGNDRINS